MLVNSVFFLGFEFLKKNKFKKLIRDYYIIIFIEEVYVVQYQDMVLKVLFLMEEIFDVFDFDVYNFVLMNIEFFLGY